MVADAQHVIPVAADFERRHRGLVANREAGRKLGGRQHGVLQGERGFPGGLELSDVLDRQPEVADQHGDQQAVFTADPSGHPKLEPQGDTAPAGEDGYDSTRLAWGIRTFDRLDSERQLMSGLLEDFPEWRIEKLPLRRQPLAGDLNRGLCSGGRPHRGHHPMHIECEAALVEGDRPDFRHALGHADRRGQAQHRAFPSCERAFGGDVAKCAHVDVVVGVVRFDPVDVGGDPHQSAVAVPDRSFVLDLGLIAQPGLL